MKGTSRDAKGGGQIAFQQCERGAIISVLWGDILRCFGVHSIAGRSMQMKACISLGKRFDFRKRRRTASISILMCVSESFNLAKDFFSAVACTELLPAFQIDSNVEAFLFDCDGTLVRPLQIDICLRARACMCACV